MKLARLDLDAVVCIHLGKSLGGAGEARHDVRDSTFTAADGWDIRETLPGVFSLHREGMPEVVTLGGYGYSYVRVALPPEPEDVSHGHDAQGDPAMSDTHAGLETPKRHNRKRKR